MNPIKLITTFLQNLKNYNVKSTAERSIVQTDLLKNYYKIFTFRRLFVYGLISNILGVLYYVIKLNENSYNLSFSRLISRKVGKIMDIKIPKFMRQLCYGRYIWFYGVNKEEIEIQDLEQYKTFREFFTRTIRVTNNLTLFRWKCDRLEIQIPRC